MRCLASRQRSLEGFLTTVSWRWPSPADEGRAEVFDQSGSPPRHKSPCRLGLVAKAQREGQGTVGRTSDVKIRHKVDCPMRE